MEFVIKVENNQPVGHPIMFDNFLMIYPGTDYNNLPNGYVKFNRVQRPTVGVFEHVSESPVYVLENGVASDVWAVTPFTEEERQQAIEEARQQQPYPSWTFIEDELRFEPPTPYPTDDKAYEWNEDITSWVEVSLPQN